MIYKFATLIRSAQAPIALIVIVTLTHSTARCSCTTAPVQFIDDGDIPGAVHWLRKSSLNCQKGACDIMGWVDGACSKLQHLSECSGDEVMHVGTCFVKSMGCVCPNC